MVHPLPTKIKAAILVGTLDITAACIQYFIKTGKGPEGILRYVASGIFGQEAFTGGNLMIIWGLLFHFTLAFAFTFFFFFIYPALQQLTTNKIITGVIYGVFTWAISTQVIVRLSNTPKPASFNVINAMIAAAILIICIGIPLAYIAGRSSKNITA